MQMHLRQLSQHVAGFLKDLSGQAYKYLITKPVKCNGIYIYLTFSEHLGPVEPLTC